jgi:hypothetical protein
MNTGRLRADSDSETILPLAAHMSIDFIRRDHLAQGVIVSIKRHWRIRTQIAQTCGSLVNTEGLLGMDRELGFQIGKPNLESSGYGTAGNSPSEPGKRS